MCLLRKWLTALSPRLLKPSGKVYKNSPQTTDSRAVSCVFVYARALAVARILFCNTPIVVRTSRLKTTDPFSVVVRRGYILLFFSKRKENTWCINTRNRIIVNSVAAFFCHVLPVYSKKLVCVCLSLHYVLFYLDQIICCIYIYGPSVVIVCVYTSAATV